MLKPKKLKGIKPLKNESDVAVFLIKNKIPFEYSHDGTITVIQPSHWNVSTEQFILVEDFIAHNFIVATRCGDRFKNALMFFKDIKCTEWISVHDHTPRLP